MKKIDLHIHSKCSDGRMTISDIIKEAAQRGIGLISITDHDTIEGQEEAIQLANPYGIKYLTGLELSITFSHPGSHSVKSISLDFLAYGYNIQYVPLVNKLRDLKEYREKRALEILEKINIELEKGNQQKFTQKDMKEIQDSVDGTFGRPHIANFLVKKGVVSNRQEAFDKYLVRCNVPKMPLSLPEASELVKGAGGKLIFAHPSDPRGTSLIKLTQDLDAQQEVIRDMMMPFIDGIECFHSMHNRKTTESYISFAQTMNLMITGGTDCHQQPVLMGSLDIPIYVAEEFGFIL